MNLRVSLQMPSAVWLVIAAVHCLAAPHPPESVPNRAYFYVHTVADLDKTIAFYRDVIGLREKGVLSAFPSDKPTRNSQINSLTNTPNAFFRPIYFELPGNDCGLELLEFTEIERKPVQPRPQDPGATFLILDVRHLDALLAKAKLGGATVVTEGGNPVLDDGTRSILLRDPDGFYLLLRQPRRIPVGAAKGLIAGAGVAVTVADLAKATAFYRDMLGLVPSHPEGGADLNRLTGVAGAQIVTGSVKIAGSTFEPQLWEFHGVDQQPIHPRMQDPGAPQFTLQFHVPAAARAYLKQERVQFLSDGVIYDPNGVLILVRGEPPNN
jgi:catechol 2,3-dioxygenase-like lactoylglutathione lyase family enzyme